MTTEPTQPPVEVGPAPANGQRQSQGHRRRRRRRKNKGSQQGAPQGQQGKQHPPDPPQPQSMQPQPKPQQHLRSGRKKKKFFQKGGGGSNGAPAPQPGNSIAPQQGRRKDKQRGPRMFVGPMDHSYRTVNGNVADGPPSTIQITSNGHGGGYYQDAYAPAASSVVVR